MAIDEVRPSVLEFSIFTLEGRLNGRPAVFFEESERISGIVEGMKMGDEKDGDEGL